MNKRTLYFGSPAYLKIKSSNLVVDNPMTGIVKSIPVDDIGLIELDNPQITITGYALSFLLKNNIAILVGDDLHMPVGLVVNPDSNVLVAQRIKMQMNTKKTVVKNIWKQIVAAKIRNQMLLLKRLGMDYKALNIKMSQVKSGDTGNKEAGAAAYYWKRVFGHPDFIRDRNGDAPNCFLNYGYSVIRSITARAIVGAGLCPSIGVFHKNQYNAYCLADDLMEPYRPFVDEIVVDIYSKFPDLLMPDRETKEKLLSVIYRETIVSEESKPLINAVNDSVASFVRILKNESQNILYPEL